MSFAIQLLLAKFTYKAKAFNEIGEIDCLSKNHLLQPNFIWPIVIYEAKVLNEIGGGSTSSWRSSRQSGRE